MYVNRLFKLIIHSYLDPFLLTIDLFRVFLQCIEKDKTKYCLGFSQTTNDFVTIESPKYLVQFSFLHV